MKPEKKKWSGMKKLSPTVKSETSNKPYSWDPRPEIRVKGAELPAISEWKVGEEYPISVNVIMESYSEEMNSETGKKEERATLRITAIGEAKS